MMKKIAFCLLATLAVSPSAQAQLRMRKVEGRRTVGTSPTNRTARPLVRSRGIGVKAYNYNGVKGPGGTLSPSFVAASA